MGFTTGNDINVLQGTDSAIVGAGEGDDIYIVTPTLMTAGQEITLSDTSGSNTLQLIGGLTIASSVVVSNAMQLTMSNGAIININGADTFTFNVGGNATTGDAGVDKDFATFVTENLGLSVPAVDAAPVTGADVTFNADGTSDTTPAVPSFSVATADADEGTTATFTVTLSEAQAAESTVAYDITAEGTTTDADYGTIAGDATTLTGTLTFAAGELTKTITVPISEDTETPEDGEGLKLTLGTVTGGDGEVIVSTTAGNATAAIIDVVPPAITYELTSSADSVLEGAIATYTVTASTAVTTDTDVTFTVVPSNSAAADQGTNDTNLDDFSAGTFNPSVITIAAGETTAVFTVTAANDGLTELPENFSVSASVAGQASTLSATTSLLDGAGTFVLTTGTDLGASFTGGIADDTFTAGDVAAGATWTTGDAIDGGAGTDTFTVVQNTALKNNPTASTVLNVETINITTGAKLGETSALNTTTFTGLTTLNTTSIGGASVTAAATTDVNVTDTLGVGAIVVNGGDDVTVTANGLTTGTVTVGAGTAANGAVIVNSTGVYADGANNTLGAIAVTGGSKITSAQTSGVTAAQNTAARTDASNFTITQSTVAATGDASTTSVTVTQSDAVTEVDSATIGKIGVVTGAVTVLDANRASTTAAGTITTVTLDSYGNGSTVNSNALTTLNLSGACGATSTLGVTGGALATAAVSTLGINANGLVAGNLTLDADYKTLNIDNSTAISTVADITSTGATAVNVTGDAKITFTDQSLTNANLSAITVTNTGGAVFGTTAIGTSTLFTGGAGDDGVVLGATTKAIVMGAGNDTVTSAGLVGTNGSVDGGDGTDTFVMTGVQADAADANATFNTKYTNFETMSLSTIAGETLNLAGLNAVANVTVGAANSSVTLNNFISNGTLNLLGTNTTVTANLTNASFNSSDDINITLTNSTGAVDAFGTVAVAGVETVDITTVTSGTGNTAATIDTLTITDTSAKSVTVSGSNGLNLTTTGMAAVTSFDASGVVADTADDTAANLGVTYASASINTTSTISITGGNGNDTLTGFVGTDTISGGAGADTLSGGKAADILTGGAGADTFSFSTTAVAADTFVLVDTTANSDAEQITITADSAHTGDETVSILYTLNGTQATIAASALSAANTANTVADEVAVLLNAVSGITSANPAAAVVTASADNEGTLVIDSITFAGTTDTLAGAIADSAADALELDTVTLSSISVGDVLSATIGANTYTQTATTTSVDGELQTFDALITAGEGITNMVVTSHTNDAIGSGKLIFTATAVGNEAGGFTASASITDTGSGLDAGLISTAGAGADTILDFNTGGVDILQLGATNNVAGIASTAAIATATVTITAGGKASFATADDTLTEMLVAVAADNTNVGNNEVVFFENGTDTYVYSAGADTTSATDDSLIKLSGVTGLTTLSEAAGDFTLA